jgi:hypothetical protein
MINGFFIFIAEIFRLASKTFYGHVTLQNGSAGVESAKASGV